jgi:hypothetical protein
MGSGVFVVRVGHPDGRCIGHLERGAEPGGVVHIHGRFWRVVETRDEPDVLGPPALVVIPEGA